MKKFMAMFLMAAMLANVASVAGAVSLGESKNFEIYVQCRNTIPIWMKRMFMLTKIKILM